MKRLVIAEKPSMARSISQAIRGEHFQKHEGYLEGNNYIISWCFGHLYELQDLDKYFDDYDPKAKVVWKLDRLPFYPDQWRFRYTMKRDPKTKQVDAGVKKQILTLRSLMNREDVDTIYAAGDADREGEVIVRLVIEGNLKSTKKVLRLWLPDLTEAVICDGLVSAKPDSEYTNLYEAGKARAAMDWLIGIELTRYASIKSQQFLRVGRCICPIVKHIVDREKAIRDFVPKPYLAVVSAEETAGVKIELQSKQVFEKEEISAAQAYADNMNAAGAFVADVVSERKAIARPKLFFQTDLQNKVCEENKDMTPAMVLETVQSLYEKGYVTYPRTSSAYLSEGEIQKVDGIISALLEAGYGGLRNRPRDKNVYDGSKVESHSALTPTTKITNGLEGREKIVYECILNRFMAVFCEEDCVVDRTTVLIQCGEERFKLKSDISFTEGWKKYAGGAAKEKQLPKLATGDKVNVKFSPVEKQTTPPKRFTVKSLNNWMLTPLRGEDKPQGEYTDDEWKDILSEATICTEATRADTLSHCQQSKYISLRNGAYYAEPVGFFLVDVMDSLGINLDVQTTVELSKNLHDVKEGKLSKTDVLDTTKKTMDTIFAADGSVKSQYQKEAAAAARGVVAKCPKCGGDVIETKKAFACANRCGIVIWKENKILDSVGKKMSKQMAIRLLANHKVKLAGCVGKSGKTFDCYAVYDPSEEKPMLKLDFEKESVGKCPVCGTGEMLEWPKAFQCNNPGCRASLWKKMKYFDNELSITQSKAIKLLSNQTADFTVKGKDGTPYKTQLSLAKCEYKGKIYLNLAHLKK